MSKPLIPNKQRESDAAWFHREVFRAHGSKCWHCKGDATDASHVIKRALLGPKMRYAMPVENGRPACRRCHRLQEAGTISFPLGVIRAAIRAHNQIAKIPLREV